MIPMLVFCAGLAIGGAAPGRRIGHNNHARLVAIHRHTVRWRGPAWRLVCSPPSAAPCSPAPRPQAIRRLAPAALGMD